ncbi:unnamed protein product [Discula destructiva]
MTDSKGSVLVTGANGGLGSAIVSRIAMNLDLKTYHGIYTARDAISATKLDATLRDAELPATAPSHTYEKLSLDLSRLGEVRKVAADINSRVKVGRIPPIHALVLNAGLEEFEQQTWTGDGLDLTFASNYLGHWLLTLMLLESMDREKGRVVWITSWSHNPQDRRNLGKGAFSESRYRQFITDDLEPIAKGTWSANKDDTTNWAAGYRRYGASKLCGVMMIHELQRRLDQDSLLKNISVLAVDPGAMSTGIARRSDSWFMRVVMFRLLLPALAAIWTLLFGPNGAIRTLQQSAHDVVKAAVDCGPPPLSEHPKSMFLNGSELGNCNPEAKDPKKWDIVWKGSVRYARLGEGETILENWR